MPESLNPYPMEPFKARLKNPLSLAYLGDTVWDLLVRRSLLDSEAHANALHRKAVAQVNAGAQALAADKLESRFSEEEADIFRRGCNAHSKHNTPKNQDPVAYSKATGLEALFGYLYLTSRYDRILELFQMIQGDEPIACEKPSCGINTPKP